MRDDTKNNCVSPNVREYGFWENFACGIRILGLEIRNTAQGIHNSSKEDPKSSTWNLQIHGVELSYVADYFARRLD